MNYLKASKIFSAVALLVIAYAIVRAFTLAEDMQQAEHRMKSLRDVMKECRDDVVRVKIDGRVFRLPFNAKPYIYTLENAQSRKTLSILDYACERAGGNAVNAVEFQRSFNASEYPEIFSNVGELRSLILNFGYWDKVRISRPKSDSQIYGCVLVKPYYECHLYHMYSENLRVEWRLTSLERISQNTLKEALHRSADYIKGLEETISN